MSKQEKISELVDEIKKLIDETKDPNIIKELLEAIDRAEKL